MGGDADSHFCYDVGAIRVTVFSDGSVTIPLPETFVLDVPIDRVRAALAVAGLPTETLTTSFAPVMVETGSRRVLIDTGLGPDAAAAGSTAGQLLQSMAKAGVEPDDITDVVITHCHADHVNGLLRQGQPVFPFAGILVPAVEWSFWMDDDQRAAAASERMRGLFTNNRRIFEPLKQRVRTFSWGTEILPGLTSVGTPGHSIGHTSLTISSRGRTVFLQADLTNHAALFLPHPTWAASFDQDPDKAVAIRMATYRQLAAEGTPVQAFHHPFPGLSRIDVEGSGFRLVPLDQP